MSRNAEQKKYHAAKEREYRALRKEDRDLAIETLRHAARRLFDKYGYSLGGIIDLIAERVE